MVFKKCILCGDEKTIKQFSKRITDVCTSCMMASAERTKDRKASTPSPQEPVSTPKSSYTPMTRPTARPAVKVTPKQTPKPVSSPMGYNVISTPTRPTIREGSVSYANLSEEDRRAILKAEYRVRRVKEAHEKNSKKTR